MPENAPQLRDIHVPQVSPWWPLAPAWWVLLALVVIGVIVLAIFLRRRAARRRHVDGVLAGVHAAAVRYAEDHDAPAFAAEASQLLRRVARTRDPHSVTLTGVAWREALAGMAPRQDVTRLSALDAAIYRPSSDIDVGAITRDLDAWVRAVLRRSSNTSKTSDRRGQPHVAS